MKEEQNSIGCFGIMIVFIVVFFAFYWILIRPSQIKSECGEYAGTAPVDSYNYYYNACLHRKGL